MDDPSAMIVNAPFWPDADHVAVFVPADGPMLASKCSRVVSEDDFSSDVAT
jgi:hypothetical protein